jgi:hypothetical protein
MNDADSVLINTVVPENHSMRELAGSGYSMTATVPITWHATIIRNMEDKEAIPMFCKTNSGNW